MNIGADFVQGKDQTSVTKPQVDSNGWSVWATPRFGTSGWELLLRHDDFKPNKSLPSQTQKRDIFGIAYWVPNLNKVTAAVLLDYDSLSRTGLTPSVADTTNYGLKMLINF